MQSVQLLKLCKQFVLYLCQAMLFSFHTASHDCKPTPAYILQRGRNSRCLVHSLSVTLLNQRFTQCLVWNPALIAIPLFLLRVGTLHLFRMQGWLHEAPYSWLLIIPCCSSSRTWALRLALASFTKPSFWTSHSETFPKLRVPLDSFSSQHGWFLSSGINISLWVPPFSILAQVLQQTVCNHLTLADGRPVCDKYRAFIRFLLLCPRQPTERGVCLVSLVPAGMRVHPHQRGEAWQQTGPAAGAASRELISWTTSMQRKGWSGNDERT